jgi:hypothetical protein
VLFHRGPLTDADREQIRPLEAQLDASLVNIAFRKVDVSQFDAASKNGDAKEGDASKESVADAALFAALGNPSLPSLVVQYPAHLDIQKPVWVSSLSREATASLTDSTVRQELTRRLASGQTAVWLLLETGQSQQDDSAAALVEAEIKKLEQELKLPELTTAPEDAILSDTPLKVAFSLIRVKRDSEAEKALVAMLIGSEPDLAERSDPMVFPVFGRGRALWALIGAGVTAKNIQDSAAFLVGACSCEVKEQNPGFDLLLAADWDMLLSQGGIPLAAAATPSTPPAEAELVPIPTGAGPTEVTTPAPVVVKHSYLPTFLIGGKVWLLGGVVLTTVLLIAAAVALGQTRRASR